MGDTHRDPVDHLRTVLPRSGAALKDVYLLPGLVLLAISVVAVPSALASAGFMQAGSAVGIAVVALIAGGLGVVALRLERRRIDRLERSHRFDLTHR